ncbi:MAG: hypothetical protein CSA20_03430 [Deltaproteobacteria bacterium]|nr:MAG: hypothetical protein CSB23_02580 [Deltaproteobacteria bacterium]PIE73152.1 MAG: hypothetical protein CSA20_03430 [Deltaproteobacteria bacterium]
MSDHIDIESGYDNEPAERLSPLPQDLAVQYYDIEMQLYKEDAEFYASFVEERDHILELGCGSGRVSRYLAAHKRVELTGIDISEAALHRAEKQLLPGLRFVKMDMRDLHFSRAFTTVIIPYNTLNLLTGRSDILRCLRGCQKYLQKDGLLLAQIFTPSKRALISKKKTFQFQIFDDTAGGRLIKEIRKTYDSSSETIQVEERYRPRPSSPRKQREDYRRCYTVSGFQGSHWLSLFEAAGFSVQHHYQDFQGTPYHQQASRLIVVCRKKILKSRNRTPDLFCS